MTDDRSPDLRVALTCRVCTHYRTPILEALANRPGVDLTVLHGRDVPGTKLQNDTNPSSLRRIAQITFAVPGIPLAFHPMTAFNLWKVHPSVVLSEGGSNALTNMLVLAYCCLTRTPMVWWTLGELPGRRPTLRHRWFRRLAQWQERRATAFVAYSTQAMGYLDRMGMPSEACFLAVNSIDTSNAVEPRRGDDADPPLLEELTTSGERVVLYVGALTETKRVDRLLRSFASCSSETRGAAVLLVVGSGNQRGRLEELARELAIEHRTHFLGNVVDGVDACFRVADVFVLPGLGGLAIGQALAHGVPVICGRADGTEQDLVLDGVTGFRCQDDAALEQFIAEKIDVVISDHELRTKLGQQALQHASFHDGKALTDSLVRALSYAANRG